MKKPASSWRLLLVAAVALALIAMALGVAACGGSGSSGGSTSSSMADTVVGAGATFPYPLYSKWGSDYAATGAGKINYQGIGSGGGISAVTNGTVDFGGSDADACACQGTAGRAGPPASPASSAGDHQAGLPPALIWLCHMLLTALTVFDGMLTY